MQSKEYKNMYEKWKREVDIEILEYNFQQEKLFRGEES